MPEQDQSPLCAAIAAFAAKIKRYRGRSIGEQNTKASLIEPLLEALGWDIRDYDEIHREFKAKPSDKPVDYALKMLRRPRLFIEAKGLDDLRGLVCHQRGHSLFSGCHQRGHSLFSGGRRS